MKLRFNPEEPLCFVFCCGYEELGYFRYLREKYNNCRIVKLHRDKVSVFLDGHEDFDSVYNGKIKSPYDLLYLFDENEAKKYNGIYTPLISFNSKIYINKLDRYPLSDVFFAGRAKNRLPKLMEMYEKLTKLGLKVEYYLTDVPLEKRKDFPGIKYSNKILPYKEMLYRSVNSRCMLDINQKGSNGYTQRFLEALMYNKKLITDNDKIKNIQLYNGKYIKHVNDIDITIKDFILNDMVVDYKYNNNFSPVRLIEDIDNRLCIMDEKEMRRHD